MNIDVAPTADAAGVRAATFVAERLREAAERSGRASLALSGGRSPIRMFEELAKAELPLDVLDLFQVDERLAPDGDPDRNLTLIREHLLSNVHLPVGRLHPMPVGMPSLEEAAARYTHTLETVCGSPPVLDVVHLGIGSDGHTASLVPGDPVLDVRGAEVAATGEYEGRRRLTFTVPALDRAHHRVWLVTGGEKAEALRRLVGSDGIPAALLRREGATVFADAEAAGRIDVGSDSEA